MGYVEEGEVAGVAVAVQQDVAVLAAFAGTYVGGEGG